jgi:SAM-dependent methyltransferase
MWLAKLFPSVRRILKENEELRTELGSIRKATIPQPPPELVQQIGGPLERGFYWLDYLKSSGLKPHHSLLDLGSGIGRLAIPLTKYLTTGHYSGLDVLEPSIRWCQENITSRYPSFRFHRADLHNSFFNPSANTQASDYVFPFPVQAFDWVTALSLFTHLQPAAKSNYLRQAAVALKPGGYMLATFFLLNERSLNLIQRGESLISFKHSLGPARVASLDSPDDAVAYDESAVYREIEDVGLKVVSVRYGQWVKPGADVQDAIIAIRA